MLAVSQTSKEHVIRKESSILNNDKSLLVPGSNYRAKQSKRAEEEMQPSLARTEVER